MFKTQEDADVRMMVGQFEVKALDRKERTFEGDLSTSHLDLGDGFAKDIVHPGAFQRTKAFFDNAEDPYIPLLDSHDQWSILNVFGHLTDMEEKLTGKTLTHTLEGGKVVSVPEMVLKTNWQVIDGDDGARIMDRLRPGSVRKMSMGYRPVEWDMATLEDGTRLRNLKEVMLREGSLVVFGMNPEAEVDLATVKAFLASEEGKDLTDAQRGEMLRVHQAIGKLLGVRPAIEGEGPDDQHGQPKEADPDLVAKIADGILALQADRLSNRIKSVRRSSLLGS